MVLLTFVSCSDFGRFNDDFHFPIGLALIQPPVTGESVELSFTGDVNPNLVQEPATGWQEVIMPNTQLLDLKRRQKKSKFDMFFSEFLNLKYRKNTFLCVF